MRWVATFMAAAAVIGFGWVFTLPSKAECLASGRMVDPTERHCVSVTGYQQLEEHALFHSREIVLGAAVLLLCSYAVHRHLRRRRPRHGAPHA